MNSAKTMSSYLETPVHTSKKRDLMVVSEMTSTKIINYLVHRHKVGLLQISNLLLLAYITWDKVHVLFH